MGAGNSTALTNYVSVKNAIDNNGLIINVLPENDQETIIPGTVTVDKEVETLNNLINTDKGTAIIVYGRSACDDKTFNKARQLQKLGFTNVRIYAGGLF